MKKSEEFIIKYVGPAIAVGIAYVAFALLLYIIQHPEVTRPLN